MISSIRETNEVAYPYEQHNQGSNDRAWGWRPRQLSGLVSVGVAGVVLSCLRLGFTYESASSSQSLHSNGSNG